MKKFLAVLLVLVMTVTCFAGCTPKKSAGSDLGNTLNQISKFSDADGFKTEANISFGVTFDDAVLSEDRLGALLGEAAPVFKPLLSLFIKDERNAEFVISAKGVGTKNGEQQLLMTIGKGENALTYTGITAGDDIYIDAKTIYTWMGDILAPAMGGESLPVWPYQNAYISGKAFIALLSGMMGGNEDLESDMQVSPVSYVEENQTVQAVGGLGAISAMNPQMMEAVLNGLMDAIPKETLADLVNILEKTLIDAGMLTTKDGYVTITINGDNITALPDAFVNAADGKLATIIDSVVNGIRNSDNEIIASMIPADEEINGQELEDELIAELQAAKDDFQEAAQEMKNMNFNGTIGIKANDKVIEYRLAVGCRIEDEEGYAGNISLSVSTKMEAAKDVSVRAPGNVMTETELSDFFSAFAQNMG
ncbi:MAG: hypothetical protein IKV74_04080 [Clostridia bacterium]|nr:hypothetical protein [Clostridia bacterium]